MSSITGKRKTVDGVEEGDFDRIKVRRTLVDSTSTNQNRTVTLPDATGIVLLDTTAPSSVTTLTTAVRIVDTVDATKKIAFSDNQLTTGTTATIQCAAGGNRTVTLPNATGTVILDTTAPSTVTTLTTDLRIVDPVDQTKKIAFLDDQLTTGSTMTLRCAAGGNNTVTIPAMTDKLVGEVTSQTLVNKSFLTTTTNPTVIFDGDEPTKQLMFDLSNSGGSGVLTLRSSMSVPRTVQFVDPGANDDLIYANATQNLANKTLRTSTTTLTDGTDTTKSLKIDLSGETTGTRLTLASTVAANRTVTFPDPGANDTVTYNLATQTLTNKNLNAGSVSFFANADSTKKIVLDPTAAAASTTLTISSNLSANRTITVNDPGNSCSFVLTQGNQGISGTKTFSSSTFFPVGTSTSAAVGLNGGGAVGISSSASTTLYLIASSTTLGTLTTTSCQLNKPLQVSSNGSLIGNIQFGTNSVSNVISAGSPANLATLSLTGFTAVPIVTAMIIAPSGGNQWDSVLCSVAFGATSSSVTIVGKNHGSGSTSGTATLQWVAMGA